MTNLEWLTEHDTDAVRDALRCFIDGETIGCSECAYDKHRVDGVCMNSSEWLLAEHVDDESCNQVADQRERAETQHASKWQANDAQSDSREKLEADALSFANGFIRKHNGAISWNDELYRGIIELLDRQAAITESNCRIEYEDMRDYLQGLVADLEDGNAALEKELKLTQGNLKVTLNNWEQDKGKIRRQTEELAERRRKLDERDQKTVEEIRDDRADYWKSRAEKAEKEREQWRSKCGKLMGLANEMMSA